MTEPFPSSSEEGQAYLSGAPVTFGEAVAGAFANIFTYTGRASKSAFWWWVLCYVAVGVIEGILKYIPLLGPPVGGLVGLVVFFTGLAVAARRLHDTDRSALWLLLILIPVIGWIPLLLWYLESGTPGPNQYG